ncbi:ABC transporter ATP-binding protein [Lacticaseibacillus camelliae]|uniref:ABC transporter ATP-binding protein n=1 Tax=Lacticaseibacillus camelliae TaxID=381742 RepID=UPI000B2BD30C
MIGPNGAGKTTLFNMLTGVIPPTSGKISLTTATGTISLLGHKPYQVAKLGLARTFQNIRLFANLSVRDNLLAAMTHATRRTSSRRSCACRPTTKKEAKVGAWTDALLREFDLTDVADVDAGNLPYGTQRRVEIARATATSPRIIFLDEPAAGMNPEETAALMKLIGKLRSDFQLTVVLIEHDMSLVMNIAERIYVLNQGKLIAEGTPAAIQKNPAVIDSYLGGGVHA